MFDKIKIPALLLMALGIILICIDHFGLGETTWLSYVGFFGVIGVPFTALVGAGFYNYFTKDK